MGDMSSRHQQTTIADSSLAPTQAGPTVDRDMLSEGIVIPDVEPSFLPDTLLVLRICSEDDTWIERVVLTQCGPIHDAHPMRQHRMSTDGDVWTHETVGSDHCIGMYLSGGIHHCRWVNGTCHLNHRPFLRSKHTPLKFRPVSAANVSATC